MARKPSQRKSDILGRSFSSAYQRMLKNIIYEKIIVENNIKCMRCGEEMTREDFTIDHIENWTGSENPYESLIDSDNCDFSHSKCNTKEAADRRRMGHGNRGEYNRGCRCDECKESEKQYRKNNRIYDPKKRREKYLRRGT